MPATQCPPSEADWYVEVVWGKTQCEEHGTKCRREACERYYGTYTDYRDAYFKGDRPTLAERDAMMPPGAYRLKSKVKLLRARWIVYLHVDIPNSMSFELQRVNSLDQAKDSLRAHGENTGMGQQTSARLYPWSPEDWASAKEFEGVGCPFDYPSLLLEWGPRGGIRVENT